MLYACISKRSVVHFNLPVNVLKPIALRPDDYGPQSKRLLANITWRQQRDGRHGTVTTTTKDDNM